MYGTSLVRKHSWGWQLGSFWWQNARHMGDGLGFTQVLHPQHGMFSQGWDLLGCFSVFQCPDWVLFLPSPPYEPCHQHLWGVQSLGNHVSLHPKTPQQGCPHLEAILRVISDFSALRGGAQRRPVPKCSRGADQLPVHGTHVPLCRGPGACVESHGRSWGQQVSCSHCSKMLSWSQQLSGPHNV